MHSLAHILGLLGCVGVTVQPFYKKHVFFCTNLKAGDKKCCQQAGACDMQAYAKKRLQALELHGPDKVRVSASGCLGRCKLGPCLVIYPEGIWYTYNNQDDIDEIIQRYLINGEVVERLRIPEAEMIANKPLTAECE